MPSWRVSRKASLSNQITHFGIMGGLSNSRVATHTNRATNTLRIPKPAAAGLQFMRMHNLLSKNPQGSGGVGKMVKNSPCNCRSVVKKTVVTLEDNNLGEDSLGDNKPNVSCMPCYDASKNLGCSFKSQSDNHYCCPSGNYHMSGCNTSEHVCYINEPDNSGGLATRFSHCPSGACVWDGTGDINEVFSSCHSDTVIITQDISNISQTIIVPKDKTLLSYGKLSFSDISNNGIVILGAATFLDTLTFSDISNNGYGIYIDASGTGNFHDVSFGNINNGTGIVIDGLGTFLNTVSFGDISNNSIGIHIEASGTGNFHDVSFGNISNIGKGIYIDGSGTFLDTLTFGDISNTGIGIYIDGSGTFLNTVSFSDINNGYDIYIGPLGTGNFHDVSFSDINNGYGIKIDGSGTFQNTVSFSDISNNGTGILMNGSGTFLNTVSFSDINNGYDIYIGPLGTGNFHDVSFGDIINNGYGIYIDGSGTGTFHDVSFGNISINYSFGILVDVSGTGHFQNTVSFSDISNNGIGIYIDGSAIFNDICFNKPLINGHGIDAGQNSDFSYNKICGEPSGNVWPENKQKNFYPCEQSS